MREAYFISFAGTARCNHTRSVLQNSGFNPVRVEPVDLSESKIYAKRMNIVGHTSKVSNLLTHLRLWNDAAKAKRDTYTYIFEDDIDLSPTIDRHDLHRKLDSIERLRDNIIHLGECAEHFRSPITSSWIRCAVLCSHAYAVLSSSAEWLSTRMLDAAKKRNSMYYKTGWDVIMRGYYVHEEKNQTRWPICSKPYMYYQNRTKFYSIIDSSDRVSVRN